MVLLALGAGVAHAQSYMSGFMLERAGQPGQAFEEYRLSVNKEPRDMPSYDGLVRLADTLKRCDTLVAVSLRLEKQFPDVADYSYGLVSGLLGLKRTADARVEGRRAALKWPDRLATLGEVFAGHQDYASAIDYYEQALRHGADRMAIADRLVDLYDASGQPAAATREIVSVINASPQALDRYRQKLSALAVRSGAGIAGELEKVSDPATRALAKAVVYLATKNEAEAVHVLKPVLSGQELYEFAHDCEAQGALRAALAVYQEQKVHVDAARVLRTMGRVPEALAELAMDDGVGAQIELGDLCRDQGDYARALASYQRALARQPASEPAVFGQAAALLGLGHTEPARAAAMKLVHSSDRLLLLVARTFFYEGQFDSAGAYLNELVRQFPQSLLVNDGLDLAVLTGSGDRAKELARLMLDYETGADEADKAQTLADGDDAVAQQACFLLARFLRREHKPKEALAALDRYCQRFGSSSLAPKARLEQAGVYRDDLKDEAKYRETLQQLILEYPGSAYVPIARSLLAEAEKPVSPEPVR
ncbi:MAG TPA: tetratricopeptide repeat protein [bacterium]|nr:tetratricopeptide repeat protein [bacterium]